MSARDYEHYRQSLPALRGRKSSVTLAANSIKLHIDEDKENGTFLWLDPPWEFRRDGAVIETAATCPDHTEPDYEPRFQSWCERFEPIFDSTIRDIAATPDGSLQVTFEDRYEVFLPANDSAQSDSWYDHWYYREPKKT